jgi:lipopolysaccharide/colanic/teichoic acid biosynthesis glycosyltransferase
MLPVSGARAGVAHVDIGEVHRGRYGRFKRATDLIGLVALPVLLLAILFVAVGNLLGNGSLLQPAEGRQERRAVPHLQVPHHARRTRGSVTEWTAEDDPRITSFGRLLHCLITTSCRGQHVRRPVRRRSRLSSHRRRLRRLIRPAPPGAS